MRLPQPMPAPKARRLTPELIVDVAISQMSTNGYDKVTIRSIAKELETGSASLYAHVANRALLDQLVVDRIVSSVSLPKPDGRRWRAQVLDVLRDLLNAYRAHPGVARAAMANIPNTAASLDLADHLLGLLLAGRVQPQDAAWAVDALLLHVGAVAFEESVWSDREGIAESALPEAPSLNEDLVTYFETLDEHPHLSANARHLASGTPQARFEFAIQSILAGLRVQPSSGAKSA